MIIRQFICKIASFRKQFYYKQDLNFMSQSITKQKFPNKYSNICFISLNEMGNYRICKLKNSTESLPQASFSPILTLGAYILFHHPTVQPPRFQCHDKTNNKIDTHYPSEQLTVNNYHEIWNDYITHLVTEGKIYQQNTEMYFMDFVGKDYLQHLQKSDIFEFADIHNKNLEELKDQKNFTKIIQQSFGLQKKIIQKKRKMAAVCFSAANNLCPQRYMPKVHIGALFMGEFYREGDQWQIYRPVRGVYPSEQQLLQLDGIILSGSSFSAYDNIPQINRFMKMLKEAYHKNKKLQILGFCFGHQIIAYEFGGKVQPMKSGVVYLQNIKFDTNKLKQVNLPYLDLKSTFLSGQQSYLVSQFHNDQVSQLPPGFALIGSSQSCSSEAMCSIDGRILSFQFHMEYTPQFSGAFQLRLRSYDPHCRYGRIYDGSSKLKSCDRNLRSVLELREISRKFLQSNN